jgi:hypothetical protein
MALPNTYTNLTLNESMEDSLLAGAAIALYQRVYLTQTGVILPANNVADYSIGVAKQAIANASWGTVRLHMPMQYGLANANINVGDPVAIAVDGKITPTLANTTSVVGVAKTPTNQGTNVALAYYGVRNGAAAA